MREGGFDLRSQYLFSELFCFSVDRPDLYKKGPVFRPKWGLKYLGQLTGHSSLLIILGGSGGSIYEGSVSTLCIEIKY